MGVLGAMRPQRQHSRPLEAGAGGLHGAGFGRLVQEEQRLKKQQDRSIQIQRLLLLESFVDKVDKPCVRVNLVGPQVSLPLWWVPASRGSIHFFCA